METGLPQIAKALQTLDRREISAWLKRGELLSQAKQLCGGDRAFASWLRTAGQARSTAYKALAAWTNFGSVPTSERFSKSAMDLLAQSEPARAEAIRLSTKARITATVARKLLQEHGAAQPTTPKVAPIGDRKKTFSGEGWLLSITLETPGTIADYVGAMNQAIAKLREEMLSSRRAA